MKGIKKEKERRGFKKEKRKKEGWTDRSGGEGGVVEKGQEWMYGCTG